MVCGIGRAFASFKGFNTRILYHNRTQNPEAEKELDATYVSFETLLKKVTLSFVQHR